MKIRKQAIAKITAGLMINIGKICKPPRRWKRIWNPGKCDLPSTRSKRDASGRSRISSIGWLLFTQENFDRAVRVPNA